MTSEDRFASLRDKLNEPEPEQFKFEQIGDEIIAELVRWEHRTVKSGERVPAPVFITDDNEFYWVLLSKDLVTKLVTDRDVRPGDLVAIRLVRIDSKSGFKEHKVRVDPDRPRTAPAAAEPWGYDDDGAPMPDPPFGDEPPF
jgi:hypothetical protein